MNEVSGLKDNQEWWGVWTTGEGDTLPFPAFASCGDEGPMLPNLPTLKVKHLGFSMLEIIQFGVLILLNFVLL